MTITYRISTIQRIFVLEPVSRAIVIKKEKSGEFMKIETLCVHSPKEDKNAHVYGAMNVPIFQTATFSHPGVGESTGYDYSRQSNPTRTELEDTVTALEKAYDTVACSTGMAACMLVLELFGAKDNIISQEDIYGGTTRLFNTLGVDRGRTFTYVDTTKPENVINAINENTRAIFIESPSNPTMMVTDIRRMAGIAKENKLLLIVDNTFLSPYFQNPISLGADIVIHSGTKYLSGHNDTLSGFICVANEELSEKIRFMYKTVGPSLSPFDSFLTLRGIKTLALRMDRIQENAIKIANYLKTNKKVTDVYYVGLREHPGYKVNLSQSRGFGGMISFKTDSHKTAVEAFERFKIIKYAESLGGVESLITFPMIQTHADVPEEVRQRLGITDTFLRMSVGIENVDDLIADLERALK